MHAAPVVAELQVKPFHLLGLGLCDRSALSHVGRFLRSTRFAQAQTGWQVLPER
jgi:hypothetical protein